VNLRSFSAAQAIGLRYAAPAAKTLAYGGMLLLVCGGGLWSAMPATAQGAEKTQSRDAEPKAQMTLESYLQRLGYGVIPLDRTAQNKLVVRAEINGRSHSLMVDSGWSVTALDASIARKSKTPGQLGVQVVDPVLGNIEQDDLVLIERFKIGAAEFRNQPVASMALKARGRSTAGVLGCDFMIRHHAILDCGAKRLYVRAEPLQPELAEALGRTLSGSGYHLARLKRSEALVPICNATINDMPVDLLVDSGGVWTILNETIARRLKLVTSRTGIRIEGVKRGMSSELLTAPVKTLKAGDRPLPLRGILIGVGDLEPWIPEGSSHVAQGVLGAELLAQSGAVIDFQSTNLWFVPDGGSR
jgi:predicted aspartyl protease